VHLADLQEIRLGYFDTPKINRVAINAFRLSRTNSKSADKCG